MYPHFAYLFLGWAPAPSPWPQKECSAKKTIYRFVFLPSHFLLLSHTEIATIKPETTECSLELANSYFMWSLCFFVSLSNPLFEEKFSFQTTKATNCKAVISALKGTTQLFMHPYKVAIIQFISYKLAAQADIKGGREHILHSCFIAFTLNRQLCLQLFY